MTTIINYNINSTKSICYFGEKFSIISITDANVNILCCIFYAFTIGVYVYSYNGTIYAKIFPPHLQTAAILHANFQYSYFFVFPW